MYTHNQQRFMYSLKTDSLNTLGIKLGDRVSVRMGYEADEDKRYKPPKELTGEVREIDCKGRWFRIVTDKGFTHCHLFADTYDNGRKLGYRILGR